MIWGILGAVADFTSAIELNPKSSKSYLNRGIAKADLGEVMGGMTDYNKAIELNPKNVQAYYVRGIARNSLAE